MAFYSATAAGCRAFSTQGMMRRMLLTDSRTDLTNFGAQRAKLDSKGRSAAHPLGCKEADIGTIPAEPDASCHHICLSPFMRHADHIVPAGVAHASAIQTGLNTFEPVLRDGMV
ncbi:hypothetical protein NSND_60116 [Nitrospira sp. ND1]|jgi:hypothetical protein|nr:hypothetical protein NSND_60116 [Nitrospira sp. ND1]